jgi:hypothetical protein
MSSAGYPCVCSYRDSRRDGIRCSVGSMVSKELGIDYSATYIAGILLLHGVLQVAMFLEVLPIALMAGPPLPPSHGASSSKGNITAPEEPSSVASVLKHMLCSNAFTIKAFKTELYSIGHQEHTL